MEKRQQAVWTNNNRIKPKKKDIPNASENSHSLCSCGARCSVTMPVRHRHPTHPLLHFRAAIILFPQFYNFWHICEGHAATWQTNKSRDKFPPKKMKERNGKTNIAIHFETHDGNGILKNDYTFYSKTLRTVRRWAIELFGSINIVEMHSLTPVRVCTVVSASHSSHYFNAHVCPLTIFRLVLFWQLFCFHHFHTEKWNENCPFTVREQRAECWIDLTSFVAAVYVAKDTSTPLPLYTRRFFYSALRNDSFFVPSRYEWNRILGGWTMKWRS